MKQLKDYLIKRFLIKDRLDLLEKKKRLYFESTSHLDIVKQQIQRFNTMWGHCCQKIPFYQTWQAKYQLPTHIESLEELKDFPLVTKRVIQENQDVIFQNGKIKRYVYTGGSTGEPTRFPSSPRDAVSTYADIYLGRSWWGIEPLDPALVFWGHTHLFGTGIRGAMNYYKRNGYDFLLNTKRLNAYDMSAQTVQKYYEVYRETHPTFVLGYPSCLYKLAKHIDENKLDRGKKNRLKAVIVTSETLTNADVELLEKVLGVPIVIEYGMTETGVIGYSFGETWHIRIFCDSFIATINSDNTLNVTTLYDKCFPLINYHTGDIVEVKEEVNGSILGISSILGRRQDVLKIGSLQGHALELSGILIVHILKRYPHIFSIQFEQLESNHIRILLVADSCLDLEQVRDFFFKEIRKDHRDIDPSCVHMTQVDHIPKTLAGKENMVRR